MLHQAIDILPKISIHTPTKGATCMGFISFFPIFDFNPHSHEGSDERKSMGMAKKLSISIHTPTKGATFVGGFPFSSSGLFQSTLPRRERLKHILMDSRSLGFQSTLPRRERLFF